MTQLRKYVMPLQEPVVFDLSHEAGVSGGMVCEVLSLLAADRLQLGFGTLQVSISPVSADDLNCSVTSLQAQSYLCKLSHSYLTTVTAVSPYG